MTTPYVTGTVSVTAGSAVVTGDSTGWDTSGLVAGILGVDGLSVPVLSVESDTSLTLAKPWPGPTASGKDYWITYDTEDGQQTVGLTQLVAEYVARLAKPFFAALSGLTPAANKLPYFGGGAVGALTDITSTGRAVIGAADQAAARTAIGAGAGNGDVAGPNGGVTAKQVAGFGSNTGKTLVGLTASEVRVAGAVPTGQIRNKFMNPLFSVNQRGVTGTVTLSANAYGHDRMRAGSGGCTYTFVSNNGVTVINITAGTLQQVVLASQFSGEPGDYYLSWVGSSQGRINNGGYGASGQVFASVDGSANVVVEFGVGTLSLVQLERGYVTPFSSRGDLELTQCRKYWRATSWRRTVTSPASGAFVDVYMDISEMRSSPALSWTFTEGAALAANIGFATPSQLYWTTTTSGAIGYSGILYHNAEV
jgi:hypothetical protein